MKLRRPLLVIDLETTGCHELSYDIIEIGAVLLDENLKELTNFTSFVKPLGISRDPAVMAINKIPEYTLQDAPSLEKVLADLENMIYRELEAWGAPTIAGWGVGFNKKFLEAGYEKVKRKYPFGHWAFDIKSVAMWELGFMTDELKGYKIGNGLDLTLEALGMEFEGTKHSAIDDAKNTARILRHLRDLRLPLWAVRR